MSRKQKVPRLEIMQGTLDLMRSFSALYAGGRCMATASRNSSSKLLKIEHGSLYPALQGLLQEGWVTAEWGISTKNRKARFYRITSTGRKQLSAEHSKWELFSGALTRILVSVHGPEDA
jgi:PadR family transcriptional regulator PadR